MARATDEELMTMFQSGNAGSFEELFKRYKGPIFTFLIRRCGNRDTASELTQEVFTRVIHRGGTFAHQSRFSTWIYTIARNAAVDHARSSRHRQHASLDQTGDDQQALSERIPGNLPLPDRGTEAASLRARVAPRALLSRGSLGHQFRQVQHGSPRRAGWGSAPCASLLLR